MKIGPPVSSRGVTVTEILVVLVIAAILAGVAMPAVNRIQTRTKLAQCANNQRQISVAMHLYANDHGGKFPPFIQGGKRLSSTGSQNTLASQMIPPKNHYLPDNQVFIDPGAEGRIYHRNPQTGWANWVSGSANRSGYWHIYMSPTSESTPERAEDSQYGANDTIYCAPFKVLMHCFQAANLEDCAHANGSVHVLRVNGNVEHYARDQYEPGKSVLINFGHKK